eukprot:gene40945-50662_t
MHVAGTLNDLAELCRERGDFTQAISYHKLSIEAFTKSVGLLHPADYSAAHSLFILAFQAKIDVHGPDHESLIEIMLGIAETYRAQAVYDEAETFLSQAMAISAHCYQSDMTLLSVASTHHAVLHVKAITQMAELMRNQGAVNVAVPLLMQ